MAPKHTINLLEFIQSFRRGDLLAEGDSRLCELVEAIERTGTNGKMTITLNIKVNKAGQFEITPGVSIKKPQRPFGVGIYFPTEGGRLSRHDPNQMDIEDEIERRRNVDAG